MDPTYAKWVQTSLNSTLKTNLEVDGSIGPKTKSAIITFQRSRGLTADGVVGPLTERALAQAGASPPPARHSGHKHWVGEVTPLLNKFRGDIPLEFLLGWIDVESGGRIGERTSLDERGYFQLHPEESKALGIQHQRLSTDPAYSIESGIKLVNKYAGMVSTRGYARGSDLFWHLVKFYHAIGPGAAPRFLDDMRQHGISPVNWATIQQYAVQNDARLLHVLKHSPAKWVHNVDELFARGRRDATLAAHN
jgi:peptidoglycan hydrolase-like protein with peptidoglycan-binding domain